MPEWWELEEVASVFREKQRILNCSCTEGRGAMPSTGKSFPFKRVGAEEEKLLLSSSDTLKLMDLQL